MPVTGVRLPPGTIHPVQSNIIDIFNGVYRKCHHVWNTVLQLYSYLSGVVWLCISRHLETRVFADSQAAHPHVCQQHLAAGVSNEVSLLGGHRQLQAGGVTPVNELVGEQLHGHLLIVLIGLIQQFVGQLSEFSA